MKSNKSNLITKGLVDYLTQTNQQDMLGQVTLELESMQKETDRIKEITVYSVVSLTPSQKDSLKDSLSKMVGMDLPLVNHLDKKLIAGLTVKIGDWFMDASLLRDLNNLKKDLND